MRLTLASGITLLRLAFLPPVIWALLSGERLLAFGLLLVAQAADMLDGVVARLRHEETPLGQLLDPVIDKFVFLVLFATLVAVGDLPWPTIAILGGIEFGMAIGAFIWLRRLSAPPPARRLGKTASFVLSIAILVALLDLPYDTYVVYGALGLVLLAGADYLRNFIRTLRADAHASSARRPPQPPQRRSEVGAEERP